MCARVYECRVCCMLSQVAQYGADWILTRAEVSKLWLILLPPSWCVHADPVHLACRRLQHASCEQLVKSLLSS